MSIELHIGIFRPGITVVLGAILWFLLPVVPMRAATRPNILFIMTDQHRWDCLGVNGNKIIQTPNLDRFARRSANFTHAFVQSPVCVPSRASFFTGRYPHSHRNRVNYTPLSRNETLMQERLRSAGYRTAAVGKLHLHPPTQKEAHRSGFDIVELHDAVSYLDHFSDYVKWRNEHDPNRKVHYRKIARDIAPGKNPFRSVIAEEYTDTAWVGLRTRHHLRKLAADEKPFFLYASFWKPHSPFETPAPYAAMYDDVEIPLPKQVSLAESERLPPPLAQLILRGKKPPYAMDRERLQWIYRSYYAAISQIDKEVGLILKTLEASGAAENTIIAFSSDHGDQLLKHGLTGKNCFFEESVRVPFIIGWPGHVKPGQHSQLVECIDLLPTLFELAGVPEPYGNQGRSLAPLITGSADRYRERTAIFSENVIPEVINGMKFFFEKGKGVRGIRHPDAKMVRTRRWKYNYYPSGSAELYDLEKDPGEYVNLAGIADHQPTEQKLKDLLLHWLTTADETDQIAPKWLIPWPPK
jgi:arylsulfatase A-like enzyme